MCMRHALAAVAAAVSIAAVTAGPAQATEYTSALKVKGVQYDVPGTDSNRCSGGNTKNEYLTIQNYSRTAKVNLKGYVVYRQNCNFIWNNDKDTIYLLKPGGAKADVHSYTKRANDPDGNGYINYHG
ncbi:lamin tail domain-containing protein [Streptomyces bobili]|uniref:lamin tail domain-containing protein n=1 Tax=Streptomyces bobili TaxID=67280 RepID=UPI003723AB81